MQLINGALFLNATALFIYLFIYLFIFALFGLVTVISPFATIYASLKLHKSDLRIGVSILTSLVTL